MKPAIKAMQEWQPYPAASSGRNRRGAAGAALRFLQAGTAPRRKNRLSARGMNGDCCLRQKQGAVSGAALRFSQGSGLRQKQGAVSGAALRFSQGSAADRSKNRLSARGNSLQEVCSPYETNY